MPESNVDLTNADPVINIYMHEYVCWSRLRVRNTRHISEHAYLHMLCKAYIIWVVRMPGLKARVVAMTSYIRCDLTLQIKSALLQGPSSSYKAQWPLSFNGSERELVEFLRTAIYRLCYISGDTRAGLSTAAKKISKAFYCPFAISHLVYSRIKCCDLIFKKVKYNALNKQ